MERTRAKTYWLRAALTAACLCLLAFIFGNSLASGDDSSAQSSVFVRAVQKLAGVFAPHSWVATATGEAYEKLHGIVRTSAHFCEFALLGALFTWCYRSYTDEKAYFFIVVCFLVLVPVVDEFLQTLTIGRAAEMKDVFTDTAGGFAGVLFAIITVAIASAIRKKRRKG